MMYDFNNIFAKILRREIPCEFILENEFAAAFHDTYPKAPVHILIVPKGPYQNSFEFYTKASTEEVVGFYHFIASVIRYLDLMDPGFNLLSNCGENAGQQIHHFHVHILSGQPFEF